MLDVPSLRLEHQHGSILDPDAMQDSDLLKKTSRESGFYCTAVRDCNRCKDEDLVLQKMHKSETWPSKMHTSETWHREGNGYTFTLPPP